MSMTPQEHYAEAERLIATLDTQLGLIEAAETVPQVHAAAAVAAAVSAGAQVHATLATGVKIEQHHHYNNNTSRGSAA